MNYRLAVTKIPPKLVKHVREVADGKAEAAHPVYEVAQHKGTGKATCRGCGEIIKEGDPALLFWNARYDKGHKLEFIRDRSVIHAEGCTDGPLVRCPHPGCGDELADGTLSQHIEDAHADRFKWQVRPRAASIKVTCLLHKKAHCGQCEEDRELEIPKFRQELLDILGIEVTAAGRYKKDPNKPPRDIKQEVTDRIIEALERGAEPWTRPWAASGLPPTSIYNKPYLGINSIILGMTQQQEGYDSPFWLTYNRAKSLGGYVKKDSKHTPIVIYKNFEKEIPDKFDEKGKPLTESRSFFSYDKVFNLDQTEGVQIPKHVQAYLEERKNRPKVDVLPEVTQILTNYKGAPPIKHVEMSSLKHSPHYSPGIDQIVLPHPYQFESPEAYARTAFHEAVHSTGHSSRLGRLVPASFGSPDYAHEELVAELGSAMLAGHVGLTSQHERNAGYVQSWLQALKGDKNFIFDAAAKAQSAVNHILGSSYESAEYNPEDYEIDKTSSKWRHTEDDGFEMWETTEKHNEYAIVESEDKYDLYTLVGSFDSPEQAKAAAEGTRTAQDGGGGGGASGGGGDGGGSAGGDGGASSGTSGDASGDSGFSSGSGDSESSDADSENTTDDGDEDPRPPSDSSCPRCGHELNPIYLIGGRTYTCSNCGYTERKKKKRTNYDLDLESRHSSWFNQIKPKTRSETEESEILSIAPQVPPILIENDAVKPKPTLNTAELFSMSATRNRVCGICGKALNSSYKGAFMGICEADRERIGLVVHEPGSRDNRAGRQ